MSWPSTTIGGRGPACQVGWVPEPATLRATRLRDAATCTHPTAKSSTISTNSAPAITMDGPSHEGPAAAPAGRRIRCRAQRARPSHPTKKAAAITTMLQRQASAPGEGTPLTEEKPTTMIRLPTEQTSAVANIVLTGRCRTFNNVSAAPGSTSAQIFPERAGKVDTRGAGHGRRPLAPRRQ